MLYLIKLKGETNTLLKIGYTKKDDLYILNPIIMKYLDSIKI